MEKVNKAILTFVLIIIMVGALYLFSDWFSKTTGYLIEDEDGEISLAKCLTENNIIMYGAKSCPDCKRQRNLFGNGFEFVNYVECIGGILECNELIIVPAWKINGKIYYGAKSLEELRILSGCA